MGPFGIYFKAQSFFFILINVAICQTINKCDDTPFIGGNCEQSQLRWSYSQKLSRCKPFSFSGCGGNTNNFNSKQECLKNCSSKNILEYQMQASRRFKRSVRPRRAIILGENGQPLDQRLQIFQQTIPQLCVNFGIPSCFKLCQSHKLFPNFKCAARLPVNMYIGCSCNLFGTPVPAITAAKAPALRPVVTAPTLPPVVMAPTLPPPVPTLPPVVTAPTVATSKAPPPTPAVIPETTRETSNENEEQGSCQKFGQPICLDQCSLSKSFYCEVQTPQGYLICPCSNYKKGSSLGGSNSQSFSEGTDIGTDIESYYDTPKTNLKQSSKQQPSSGHQTNYEDLYESVPKAVSARSSFQEETDETEPNVNIIPGCLDYPVWVVTRLQQPSTSVPNPVKNTPGYSFRKSSHECVLVNETASAETANKFLTKDDCLRCQSIIFQPTSSCDEIPGIAPDETCPDKQVQERFAYFKGKCVKYFHESCEASNNSWKSRKQCLEMCT